MFDSIPFSKRNGDAVDSSYIFSAANRKAVVCPVIDVIDDTTLEYHYHDSSGVNVGGFDWNLQFNWHAVPGRERERHLSTAEPVYTPTMAGGLFSINKAFFEKLGTYDSGFDIWGGENLELSFKVSDVRRTRSYYNPISST